MKDLAVPAGLISAHNAGFGYAFCRAFPQSLRKSLPCSVSSDESDFLDTLNYLKSLRCDSGNYVKNDN
ncbi:hypothetical protein [Rhizobium leucaenae]|uniref:hypothetical protein n=1 Tax=Rhizobium leucaenae TaxID=29450 RepID=UPI00160D4FC9|nr:hypothetical protein [Rhizobium leucaenae]MBB6303683.1 hypothetical protein [Rhizobium leucaenae]